VATRADYRGQLNNKLVGLEDEGYGDFEFTDTELNTYLEFSVARLFPAVYKVVALEDQSLTSYGTIYAGYVSTTYADRVFAVEDSTELDFITGWKVGGGGTRIQGIDTVLHDAVNLYYTDAWALPDDDVTDLGLGDIYTPLVVLGALIEALESRHDTGVRGEPPPTGTHYETQLIDRLQPRYERLKEDLAMSLPGVVL
jgi:hypothetical protein